MTIYRKVFLTPFTAAMFSSATNTFRMACAFQSTHSFLCKNNFPTVIDGNSFLNNPSNFNKHGFAPIPIVRGKLCYHTTQQLFSSSSSYSSPSSNGFRKGDMIQVEVTQFGRLGASVDIIGVGGHTDEYLIDDNDPPLGTGLVLQSEIHYFRQKRNNVDVVKGEIIPAYVENIREMIDGDIKIDVSLRPVGGNAKAKDLGEEILQKLQEISDSNDGGVGVLDIGDKSKPEEISAIFPGASKGAFKKAISALYKQGKVQPGPFSVSLME